MTKNYNVIFSFDDIRGHHTIEHETKSQNKKQAKLNTVWTFNLYDIQGKWIINQI